jgi:hypothetical protein
VAAGIQNASGIDPFQLKRYADFMQLASGLPCPAYAASIPPFYTAEVDCGDYRQARPNLALLGLLNVAYLAAPFPLSEAGPPLRQDSGPVYLYRNERTLPRAFVVHRVEVVADERQILSALSTLEPDKLALAEGGPGLPPGLPDDYQAASVTSYSPGRIVVQANIDSPGLLVLSEVWAPGWHAFDNERELQLYRVDYTLSGVYLDAGRHSVEFIYSPAAFYWGSRISIISWLILAIYLARFHHSQHAPGEHHQG